MIPKFLKSATVFDENDRKFTRITGRKLTVKIEGEGIVSAPEKVEVEKQEQGLSEVKKSINVVDLSEVGDEGVSFTFEDVLFATDKYELRPAFLTTH